MRIIPILTAITVMIALYFLVLDRQTLLNFASQTPFAGEARETPVEELAEADPVAEDNDHVVRVVALASQAQEIESAVIVRGRTEAARQVTVASETSGLVLSEPLRKGATVAADDLLCELDPGTRRASLAEARARLAEAEGRVPEAQASLAQANASFREAEINVNNARRLSEDGFASETQLISAEAVAEAAQAGIQRANSSVTAARAGIEAAEANVAVAEREIERLQIRAPFAGLLETDTAELGTLMQPGSPCATIIQLNPIKLVGYVPETEVAKVAVGAMAGARLTDGSQVRGRVTFLSRSADQTTRTFRIEIEVANDDLAIRDGQTAEIIVAADGKRAHLVPQSALTLNDDGDLGVRTVIDGKTVQFMPVTLVRDTVDGVWVSDLPDAVDIITVGQEFVIDGVTVDPTYSEAEG